jgi:hypothetical protein
MADRTNRCRSLAAIAACVAAVALSSPAWAQAPGGGNRGGGARGGADGSGGGPRADGMRGAPSADAPLNPGALVQRQLDRLEDDLMPTAAQKDAWLAFADSVQRLADEVERIRADARTGIGGPANAADRLDWIAAGVANRAALIRRIAEQGRALYGTLTPEQRKIADSRLWRPLSLLAVGVAPAVNAPGSDDMARGGGAPR